ncbi:MAG: hypothetical protein ACM3ZU_04170 [Bacteroidota bacterium]
MDGRRGRPAGYAMATGMRTRTRMRTPIFGLSTDGSEEGGQVDGASIAGRMGRCAGGGWRP